MRPKSIRAFEDKANKNLYNHMDTKGLRGIGAVPAVSSWLREVHEVHCGYDFQEAVRIHLGCVPTPVRQSRGGRKVKTKCKCGSGVASLGHIMQNSPLTHGLRVLRHNQVVYYLTQCWRKRSKIDVVHEPHLETSSSLQKPYLLIIDEKSVYVVDVQVRAEQ